MEYRREIDGLLAIAVLSVILFHAGFECARGGFLGVDVFYVISGYLITSIIARELRAGTFSLTAFYERRVRRILPALFAVMLSCLPAAWWYLDPAEMKSFASSLVAAATFSSNFLFWRTSGYFAPAAELKPLLHTWTLAVEEQFYLLYPLIMLLAWRWTKGNVGALVVAIGVASLAAAHALVTAMPAVAFYLLPTRAWQLLLGAMAAIYLPADRVRPLSPVFRQLLGSAGLALVIGAATLLHKDLPLPSAWSLVPTLGALLVLVFATRDTWTGRLLASPPPVGIGLVSYSAYLWHQPLISFTRHARLDEPGRPLMLALVCLTLAMAYLSWRYVETPFRNREFASRGRIFIWGATASLAFFGFGLAGLATKGFENRLDAERRRFLDYFENEPPQWSYFARAEMVGKYRLECDFYDTDKMRHGAPTRIPRPAIDPTCYTRNPAAEKAVFVWGDSHALHLNYGLTQTLPRSWQILQVVTSGCPAKLGAKADAEDYCNQASWFALESIRRTRPDVVVLAQDRHHEPAEMLVVADAILQAGAGRVVWVGPVPHWRMDLPKLIAHRLFKPTLRRSFVGLDTNVFDDDRRLKQVLAGRAQIQYISAIDSFCDASGCILFFGDDIARGVASWDYGHLTVPATLHFARAALARAVMGSTSDEPR